MQRKQVQSPFLRQVDMLYNPSAFQAGNAEAMALIDQYPFATLISRDQDCQISHLPMYLSEDKAELVGHFAGASPHEHTAGSHRHVAVLQGPNAYISAGWYEAPNQVPTWNYQVVHLAGPLRLTSGSVRKTPDRGQVVRNTRSTLCPRLDNPQDGPKYAGSDAGSHHQLCTENRDN